MSIQWVVLPMNLDICIMWSYDRAPFTASDPSDQKGAGVEERRKGSSTSVKTQQNNKRNV